MRSLYVSIILILLCILINAYNPSPHIKTLVSQVSHPKADVIISRPLYFSEAFNESNQLREEISTSLVQVLQVHDINVQARVYASHDDQNQAAQAISRSISFIKSLQAESIPLPAINSIVVFTKEKAKAGALEVKFSRQGE